MSTIFILIVPREFVLEQDADNRPVVTHSGSFKQASMEIPTKIMFEPMETSKPKVSFLDGSTQYSSVNSTSPDHGESDPTRVDRDLFIHSQEDPDDPTRQIMVLSVEEMVSHYLSPLTGDRHLIFHSDNEDVRLCQFIFPIDDSRDGEKILNRMKELGVGTGFGSMHIIPLSISVDSHTKPDEPSMSQSQIVSTANGNKKESKNFMDSITSRMIVEEVVNEVRASAEFSFDFVMLVVVASLISGVGLAKNNAVVVVASMLVSPLMGPILAICFGSVIYEWPMVRRAFVNECIALGICIFCGFIVGLGFSRWGVELDWPTLEMSSRGEWSGLIAGVCIAIPSGIGVALSVLGNNTNSLVGVAISASLLPPAVNTGLLVAYGLFGQVFHGEDVDSMKMYELAAVSFLLTVINIICIYFAAIGMFKVKEVAPIHNKSLLWERYIPQVKFEKTVKGAQGDEMATNLRQLIALRNQGVEMQDLDERIARDFTGDEKMVKKFLRNSARLPHARVNDHKTAAELLMSQKPARGGLFSPERSNAPRTLGSIFDAPDPKSRGWQKPSRDL